MYILFLYCFLCMTPAESQTISPKMRTTLNYKAPPVKLHHQIRVSIKVHSNPNTINTLMEGGLSGFIDKVESDPMECLPELMKYNARLNLKTKSGRFKVFFGEEIIPGGGKKGSKYMGFRIKF
jgi:hypothetical protein